MSISPKVEEIRSWLAANRPLGISDQFTLEDIDPKPWSGHFNFLIRDERVKFVLRWKGPEWGDNEGIAREYATLSALEPYRVGPRVFGKTETFFGETAEYMEYLDGKPLAPEDLEVDETLLSEVVSLVARINSVPMTLLPAPAENMTYERHKSVWRDRLRVIKNCSELISWTIRLEKLLPAAEKMLDRFEPILAASIMSGASAFTFVSAHIGHCMRTQDGLRFINWERVCTGDPAYTLAVFLASIQQVRQFDVLKRRALEEYLSIRSVDNFALLVDARLAERGVSNLVWVLWNYARQREVGVDAPAPDPEDRYARVLQILES